MSPRGWREHPIVEKLRRLAERHPVAAVAVPLFLLIALHQWRGYIQVHEAMYFIGPHRLADPEFLARDLTWSRLPPTTFLYNHMIAPFWNVLGDLGIAAVGRLTFWSLTAWSLALVARLVRFPAWALLVGCALWLLAGQSLSWCGQPLEGFQPKALAYPLFMLALSFAIERRVVLAGAFAGASAAFHIIVGGWGCLAVFSAMLWNRTSPRGLAAFVAAAAPFALPILVVTILHNRGAAPGEQALMDYVYVKFAGPHCLDLSFFITFDGWLQTALVLTATPILLYLRGTDRASRMLAHFNATLVAVYAAGVVAHFLKLYGFLKLFPFQLANAIPLLFLYVLVLLALREPPRRRLPLTASLAGVVACLWMLVYKDFVGDPTLDLPGKLVWREQHPDKALYYGNLSIPTALYKWIRENTPRDAVFATPHLEEFWVYAERAQVASIRHPPFDRAILEWYERLRALNADKPFRHAGMDVRLELNDNEAALTVEQLKRLRDRYGATHYLTLKRRDDLGAHELLTAPSYHVYALAALK